MHSRHDVTAAVRLSLTQSGLTRVPFSLEHVRLLQNQEYGRLVVQVQKCKAYFANANGTTMARHVFLSSMAKTKDLFSFQLLWRCCPSSTTVVAAYRGSASQNIL